MNELQAIPWWIFLAETHYGKMLEAILTEQI
jgi:hypothetical protein